MTAAFAILAGITVGAAIAAVTLRNLVHAALCLALCLAGLGLLYVQLQAEFAGLVQILVYVGAVAVLIVFAVLLVRGTEPPEQRLGPSSLAGISITALLGGLMVWTVLRSPVVAREAHPAPAVSVRAIGERLVREQVVPLQVLGLLLTAATIGAALIALPRRDTEPPSSTPPTP